jgi:hypothetical protein
MLDFFANQQIASIREMLREFAKFMGALNALEATLADLQRLNLGFQS